MYERFALRVREKTPHYIVQKKDKIVRLSGTKKRLN